MSGDRSIRLDLSTAQAGATPGQGGTAGGPPRSSADPDAREQFEQAMARSSQAPVAPPPAALPPGPFALFPPSGTRPAAPDGADALRTRLVDQVTRLMVGQGRSGGHQVRLDLDEEVLPGVSVTIEEEEGRLRVAFTCRDPQSHQRLLAAATRMATGLARALAREVLVCVQAEGLAPPLTALEVVGTP